MYKFIQSFKDFFGSSPTVSACNNTQNITPSAALNKAHSDIHKIKSCTGEDPSLITDVFWISHYSFGFNYPRIDEDGGKWLLFSDAQNINDLWTKIKVAQDQGLLGNRCEVTSARPTNKGKAGVYCIRVYTYNYKNDTDVMRVREALRAIGITDPINYKALYMSELYYDDFSKLLETKPAEFEYTA